MKECNDASAYAKSLTEMGMTEGMCVKVEDTRSGEVRDQFGAEEEEKVDKYEMDDEAYAKRNGESFSSVLRYQNLTCCHSLQIRSWPSSRETRWVDLLLKPLQAGRHQLWKA